MSTLSEVVAPIKTAPKGAIVVYMKGEPTGTVISWNACQYSRTLQELLEKKTKEEEVKIAPVFISLDFPDEKPNPKLIEVVIRWLNYYHSKRIGTATEKEGRYIESLFYADCKKSYTTKESYTYIMDEEEKGKIQKRILDLYKISVYLKINELCDKLNEDSKKYLSSSITYKPEG